MSSIDVFNRSYYALGTFLPWRYLGSTQLIWRLRRFPGDNLLIHRGRILFVPWSSQASILSLIERRGGVGGWGGGVRLVCS